VKGNRSPWYQTPGFHITGDVSSEIAGDGLPFFGLNGVGCTPIVEHPTLKSVGFFDKRHYNYTSKKIDEILSPKDGPETKDFAYKGDFQTFKYKKVTL